MARPLYESAADVANETAVANRLGEATGSVMKKNPKAYEIDWCAYKEGRLAAWVEIKCRKNSKNQYPTLLLSFKKIINGTMMSKMSGAAFILCVSFTDGIYYWKCPEDVSTYRIDNGGRTDRNDSQDMEPVIHIPMKEFKKL